VKENVVLTSKESWCARVAHESCLGLEVILWPEWIAHELIAERLVGHCQITL
jgi:hypothetical protein